jgi:hypothetical protein
MEKSETNGVELALLNDANKQIFSKKEKKIIRASAAASLSRARALGGHRTSTFYEPHLLG